MYFVKTPWWLKRLFNKYIWHLPNAKNTVHLSFDDGPHSTITPWVLNLLQQYQAKATFFCIGNNVDKYPAIFEQIIAANHAIGNHTYNHLNGFKTKTLAYINNTLKAENVITNTNLFRPPYGRITNAQGKALIAKGYKIIMWDVLSADFDIKLTPEQCLTILKKHTKAGSIIVFHDSEKAWPRLQYCLPKYLDWLKEKGFNSASI